MGILDFVKDAGEKLAEMGEDAALAKKIQEKIGAHGVKVKDLQVAVANNQVILKGIPASDEDKEKAMLIAGNVKGIFRVTDEMTVMAMKGKPFKTRFHTVAKGETLSAISKQMYGDSNQYNKIFEANRPMLTHPDKIYPGQVLRIPE
ncbi:MAG: peptidoglycan-binding protein LysM [Candidatus Fermentibacteraceae bacterium]